MWRQTHYDLFGLFRFTITQHSWGNCFQTFHPENFRNKHCLTALTWEWDFMWFSSSVLDLQFSAQYAQWRLSADPFLFAIEEQLFNAWWANFLWAASSASDAKSPRSQISQPVPAWQQTSLWNYSSGSVDLKDRISLLLCATLRRWAARSNNEARHTAQAFT